LFDNLTKSIELFEEYYFKNPAAGFSTNHKVECMEIIARRLTSLNWKLNKVLDDLNQRRNEYSYASKLNFRNSLIELKRHAKAIEAGLKVNGFSRRERKLTFIRLSSDIEATYKGVSFALNELSRSKNN
jgi:hypothetical protein